MRRCWSTAQAAWHSSEQQEHDKKGKQVFIARRCASTPANDDTLTLAGDFWDEDGTRVYAGSNCTVLGFMPFAFCFCRYQTTHKRGHV